MDSGREGEVKQVHLLVLHTVQPILMNIHEWWRLSSKSIEWLEIGPWQRTGSSTSQYIMQVFHNLLGVDCLDTSIPLHLRALSKSCLQSFFLLA